MKSESKRNQGRSSVVEVRGTENVPALGGVDLARLAHRPYSSRQ